MLIPIEREASCVYTVTCDPRIPGRFWGGDDMAPKDFDANSLLEQALKKSVEQAKLHI